MNTPINFELAKLLNSKGLPGVYTFYKNEKQYDLNHNKYTIADVVMWLYEKHGIWITATISSFYDENNIRTLNWDYTVYSPKDDVLISCEDDTEFKSPTEAYEAAIEYTLNNLI